MEVYWPQLIEGRAVFYKKQKDLMLSGLGFYIVVYHHRI